MDYTQFVHEYINEKGQQHYVVAQWNPNSGQYTRPLDRTERRLTGCSAEFGPLSYHQSFPTRRQALRRARYLFSPDPEEHR